MIACFQGVTEASVDLSQAEGDENEELGVEGRGRKRSSSGRPQDERVAAVQEKNRKVVTELLQSSMCSCPVTRRWKACVAHEVPLIANRTSCKFAKDTVKGVSLCILVDDLERLPVLLHSKRRGLLVCSQVDVVLWRRLKRGSGSARR